MPSWCASICTAEMGARAEKHLSLEFTSHCDRTTINMSKAPVIENDRRLRATSTIDEIAGFEAQLPRACGGWLRKDFPGASFIGRRTSSTTIRFGLCPGRRHSCGRQTGSARPLGRGSDGDPSGSGTQTCRGADTQSRDGYPDAYGEADADGVRSGRAV